MPGNLHLRAGAVLAASVLAVIGGVAAHADTVGQWTVTAPPAPTTASETLSGVTAVGAKDAWAVGSTVDGSGHSSTVATRWNGKQWLAAQSVGEGAFNGVASVGANDVWAVGTQKSSMATLAAHWNGSTWQPIVIPAEITLNTVTPDGNGGLLAAGHTASDSGCVVLHESGGTWTQEATPDATCGSINSLVRTPGTNTVLAVGEAQFAAPYHRPFAAIATPWR